MTEIWKDIPGWEGFYQASSAGRVRSIPRTKRHKSKKGLWFEMPLAGRVLRQRHNEKGYLIVSLCNLRTHRGSKICRVNRLVCSAFHGPSQGERTEAAHNDGNRENNDPDNLRWASRSENMADVAKHRQSRLAIGG